MAKRTTNIGVNIETLPANRVRTTNIGANVEYLVPNRVRTTNIGANVEYINKYQFGLPISDISKTNWSQFAGNNDAFAYNELDEGFGKDRGDGNGVDDDTTMWHTDATSNTTRTIECKLRALRDPTIHTGHVIRARVSKSSTDGAVLTGTLYLVQGTTVIAESAGTVVLGPTQQTIEYTLSEAEAANITDYTDLRLRYTASLGAGTARRCRISTLELQIPVPTTLLVVAETYHTHDAENVVLTPSSGGSTTTLVVEDANHTHAVDSVVLTAHATLATNDTFHAHVLDNITLDTDSTLVVSEASHQHIVDSIVLTSNSDLSVSETSHTLVSDNVTLGAGESLSVDDAFNVHVADNITLTSNSDLTASDAFSLHLVDSIVLTTNSDLTVSESNHVVTSDNIVLAFHAGMQVDETYHLLVSEQPTIFPTSYLGVQDSIHDHIVDNITLSTQSLLDVFSSVHLHSADNVVINASQTQLFISDIFHILLSDNLVLFEFKESDSNRTYTIESRRGATIDAYDRQSDVNQSDRIYTPIRRT